MTKSQPKRLENKSKRRAKIYRHVKWKHTKNPTQQPDWKAEATKVNAIMDQLNDLDGNIHKRKINHFTPLFESDNGEVTKPSIKPKKTPFIVLIENNATGK